MKSIELKSGMIVDFAGGFSGVVVGNGWSGEDTILTYDKGCVIVASYSNDLTYGPESNYDIERVYDTNGGWGLGLFQNLDSEGHLGRSLLWSRKSAIQDETNSELFGG